jgi:hypothetical protein
MAFGALAPGAVAPTVACADEGDRAVLVVDTGESELSYCVALPDDSVSGLDLIELAGEQHGLQYRFGYGGQAVCELAGVGADGDDCFGEYPDFWGYWRGNGSGGWTWSSTGAGSTEVEDGDVEGWSWGRGQDGSTHPSPPPTTFADVCPPLPKPAAKAKPDSREHAARAPSRSAPDDQVTTQTAESEPESKPKGGRRPPKIRTEPPRVNTESLPSPAQSNLVAAAVDDEEETSNGGPPIAGLVGLAIGATLVIGTRSRRRTN